MASKFSCIYNYFKVQKTFSLPLCILIVTASCTSVSQIDNTGLSSSSNANVSSQSPLTTGIKSHFSLLPASMSLPKNPENGAYKVCLTPDGRKYWKERIEGKNWKNWKNNFGYSGDERNKGVTTGFIKGLIPGSIQKLAKGALGVTSLYVALPIFEAMKLKSKVLGKGEAIPFCGNWCGPGHPKSMENPDVTDELDSVCRIHDHCYGKYGFRSCKCDQMFINAISRSRPLQEMNHLELQMIAYFSQSICTGGCKVFGTIKTCDEGGGTWRADMTGGSPFNDCGSTFKELVQCMKKN